MVVKNKCNLSKCYRDLELIFSNAPQTNISNKKDEYFKFLANLRW